MFNSIDDILAAATKPITPCAKTTLLATEHQNQLTKPQGSLGKLEEVAIWLAGWQKQVKPKLNRVDTLIFAGNHGVTKHGVSLFPPEVTQQMVANFTGGGAAINQICTLNGSNLKVFDIELDKPTEDFTQAAAMNETEFLQAINIGANAVSDDADLITLGEMGIGNTSAASAIALASFGGNAIEWTGAGTGLDAKRIEQKAQVIDKAVTYHQDYLDQPLEILRRLGGRELAAIFGATLAARRKHIPVILDGFICCAAIAPLFQLNSDALSIAIAGHLSQEFGHIKLLKLLNKQPLVQINMRLGEGSGAALAIGLVRAALATHNDMATFAQANISNKE